jgi:hypothetical protein
MLFIFSTPVLIRHLWQLQTILFQHWCVICALPLVTKPVRLSYFSYSCPSEPPYVKPLALPSKIRLGWKLLAVTSTLAYYATVLFTDVKKCYSSGPDLSVIITKKIANSTRFHHSQDGSTYSGKKLTQFLYTSRSSLRIKYTCFNGISIAT